MSYVIIGLLILILIFIIIDIIISSKKKIINNNEEIRALREYLKGTNEAFMQSFSNMQAKQEALKGITNNSFNQFSEKMTKQSYQNHTDQIRELHRAIKQITEDFTKFQKGIYEQINQKMDQINLKVEERLAKGFDQTNETFKQIIQRISKIDEAQRNIEKLSTEVVSLQDILTDKKSRGTFGEVELYQLLAIVYGEGNSKVYQMQHKLSNGTIADAILHTPEPLGMLCIDSKFPLENYRKMLDRSLSDEARNQYQKLFKADVKKHIDAIKNKYIIKGETANQACMFLPSEAIFAQINAYHTDLLEYSYKAGVWITSPTTLMAFLTTIQITLQNIERNKYTEVIHTELEKLAKDFGLYKIRWSKLKKEIESVSKEVSDIHITTEKISNRFDKINNVDFEQKKIENDN